MTIVYEDFNAWWDAHQACPEHGMITRNAALAAWTMAYVKYGHSTPSVAWRYRHCSGPWKYSEEEPTGESIHLFEVEALGKIT